MLVEVSSVRTKGSWCADSEMVSWRHYTTFVFWLRKPDCVGEKKRRHCTNLYRLLNEKIIKMKYPLPIIEAQIDRLRVAKIFSTIYMENGYFHVSVTSNSCKYTALIVPNGHYEFLRMPFGLCTLPSYFQKFINAIFVELAAKNTVFIYMDELYLRSISWRVERLKIALQVVNQHGLAINWKKCQFLQSRVTYFGYTTENGKVTPSHSRPGDPKKWPKINFGFPPNELY